MKILIASTPAMGHINPLLAIGQVLKEAGHELVYLTGSWLRERIERSDAQFRALSYSADIDLRSIAKVVPGLAGIPPGLEWLRVALKGCFADHIGSQHESLQQVLREFPADIILGDNTFFGVLPMLLGPRAGRPPIAVFGTFFLHWKRDDGAPHFSGLPPAESEEDRKLYAAMALDYNRIVDQPSVHVVNQILKEYNVGPLTMPLFESMVALPDAFMQLTVPGFEFPRPMPSSVHFIGTPPIIARQAPLPPWADELDGSRKVVLVTQGTVANHDFGLLVEPTLKALANEPDLLVVVTTGGRPVEAISGLIPYNARISTYLPFEWILPKVDVVVTNGGYGSVNQAMSQGIPMVTAGLTEDKADVNARVAWSGVGINLATNHASPSAVREAVRTVLDQPRYRMRVQEMAEEFRRIDTRAEILRIVKKLANSA